MGGRPAKNIEGRDPPEAADFKGDDKGYDCEKRKWFADRMQLEGRSEEYDAAAYVRAHKRCKRPADTDNRKRKERAN